MSFSNLPCPEAIMERNGWDGYNSIVDARDVFEIQITAYNQAIDDAINQLRGYIVQDCDSSCDVCATRSTDIELIKSLKQNETPKHNP